MQKNFFNYPLYLSLIGILFGVIFYLLNLIEDASLVSYTLFLLGFLATGISLAMLKNATLRIQQIASISAVIGLTLWLLSVFQVLAIRSFWAISLSLIALSLILGMYGMGHFSKGLKIVAQITVALLILFLVGVILKVDSNLFYSVGIGVFIVFSIVTLVGVMSSKKKTVAK